MSELIDSNVKQTETDAYVSIELGQWYWLTKGKNTYLVCVARTGSNYAYLESPSYSGRVHFDEFFKVCKPAPDAQSVIDGYIAEFQAEIQQTMRAIHQKMRSLSLSSPGANLGTSVQNPSASSGSLIALNGVDNTKVYKENLIKLKDTEIYEARREISNKTQYMQNWLLAKVGGDMAVADYLENAVDKIKDRLKDFSVYVGVFEKIDHIRKGDPAGADNRLHVMQRKLFMDEECLAAYTTGGIEFSSIKQFDRWLAKDENFDRLMPFPKCMVAFQIRRKDKDRECDGTFYSVYINMQMRDDDKYTYLYVRNGENLYRVISDHEFGDHLFPDECEINCNEPMRGKPDSWWRDGSNDKISFITEREYEVLVAEENQRVANSKKWLKENEPKGKKERAKPWQWNNPFKEDYPDRKLKELERFDRSSVYYDDMAQAIASKLQDYNRVSLLIQGLFDRTSILKPCHSVRLWDSKGIEEAIKLVYDGANVIHHGAEPSFEEYRDRLNASLKVGSNISGPIIAWRKLARIERAENRYLESYETRSGKYAGSGPPDICRVSSIRKGMVTVHWSQESERIWGRMVKRSLTLPIIEVLNVDAYTPGDFRPFYADPRSRQKYFKWADFMLAAEEFHAENLQVGSHKRRKTKE